MRIREIALALPLVIGFAACKTSSTQGSRTASTEEGRTGAGASAQAGTGDAGASGRVSGSTTEPSTSGSARSPDGTAPTDTSTGSASSQQGSTYGSSQQGSSYGSMGGASASGDMKAHSDDQVVSGKISAVSAESLTITTDSGDRRTLELVPQTSLQVNGQEGRSSDLTEGLPVRASYNTVGDRDVAVDVRAGTGVSDQSGQHDTGLTPGSNKQN